MEELDTLPVKYYYGSIPIELALYQNYPNPFNPATSIRFKLPVQSKIMVQITDRNSSKVIKTLIDREMNAGQHQVLWDAKDDSGHYVTNNIYSYHLIKDSTIFTKKMLLNMADPQYIKSLNCIPLATTDSNGKIEISFDNFPIYEEVIWSDASGNLLGNLTIPNTLDLFFIKDGFENITKKVTLESGKNINLSVTLISN